jgi:hypothetical protein
LHAALLKNGNEIFAVSESKNVKIFVFQSPAKIT